MNQLSLILYLGNVVTNLGPLFFIFGSMAVVSSICLIVRHYIERDELVYALTYRNRCDDDVAALLLKVQRKKMIAPYIAGLGAFVLFALASLCPSSDTVYAVAASQVGEQALKTPLAAKAGKAIDAWLDRQISKPASEENKKSDN